MIVLDNYFTTDTIDFQMNTRSNTITAAAYMLGVSEDTVLAWMESQDRIRQLELENKQLKQQIQNGIEDKSKIQARINEIFG